MTDTLEALRHKIDGARDLAAVVRTMKALAAANIGQYENAVHALQDYYRTVELGLIVCLRHLPATRAQAHLQIPMQTPNGAQGAIGVVVFGSDQGLVGQFNDVLAGYVVREFEPADQPSKIWTIGERIQSRLSDQGLTVEQSYPVPNSVAGITPLVTQLLADCEAQRQRGELAELHVVHNRPTGAGGYAVHRQRLLPLDSAWQAQLTALSWPTKSLPEVAPSGPAPLTALLYEYVFVSLFKACAESLASENASRLTAMQRAERNIRDMLAQLTQTFHQARQTSIDEELFDVIAGYEVLDKRNGQIRGGDAP